MARGRPNEGGGRGGGDETLEGTLERVVFQAKDTQWTVARLAVAGRALDVTIVGSLIGLSEGATLRLHGQWQQDKKYGEQFRVVSYQTLTPATIAGIERYLGSGMIPGIGGELARRIVAHFGMETLEIINQDPGRLVEVAGIGKVRVERIKARWQEQREIQDVMVFLQGHGVSPAFAQRILKQYGPNAIAIVRQNPYRLALDIWGIGFKSADAIARSLGIAKTAPARAEAGLLHVLGELVEEGHMHAPEHSLLAAAEKTLDVGAEILQPAIELLVTAGHLVREALGDRGDCLSLRWLWEAETAAAAKVARLAATPAEPIQIDVERALEWFEKEHGLHLAAQQREAIRAAVRDKVVVVTGGPGVGKTTIVNAIIRILEKKQRRIALAAPTGRAAKRLTETTGRPAMTLHRLLEFMPRTGRFERNADHPLAADVVIIDEASMIDVPLFAGLVAAVPPGAQLVLVGDIDQLPSVGPGRVLAEVIASRRAVVVRLTEIFRQAAASSIVVNAHRVNRGELPALDTPLAGPGNSDFYFLSREQPLEVLATVLEVVAERIPRRFGLDALRDVQVLTPMHRGDVGAQNLNLALQTRLNPARPGRPEVVRAGRTYRQGDKVMQVRNDYDKEVFNGDLGRIAGFQDDLDGEERQVMVDFDGRLVTYGLDELDQLVHGYALSIHKSQGSEYPAVVIPVVTQHFMLLQRNLLYTGITRGKQLVILVGSRKALGIAVRSDETKLRWTWLGRRIAEAALADC